MGQKINPHGFRVGVIKDWDSRWYASDEKVGDLLVEDHKIREYLKKTLYSAGVPKIEIERSNEVVTVFLHCSRPGVVIGKGGEQIEQYRLVLEKMTGKKVKLNIVEVANPDMDAQLVAESIAQQLEKRISFRRAMKNSMARAMRAGAKGIKTGCGGRLGGAEIARSEHYHEGTIPLQTIRADIDYGFAEAATTYGRIGVKVWIYKGEVLSQTLRTTPRTMDTTKPYQERRERRPRQGGFGGGGNRGGQGGGFGGNRGGQGGGFGGNRGPSGGQGGYNRGPSTGGFNRGPATGAPAGGYNRAPGAAPAGGFNRAPGAPAGGFNRAPGGFNRAPGAAPAGNRTPGTPVTFIRNTNTAANVSRPASAPASAPATTAPTKEGGAQ